MKNAPFGLSQLAEKLLEDVTIIISDHYETQYPCCVSTHILGFNPPLVSEGGKSRGGLNPRMDPKKSNFRPPAAGSNNDKPHFWTFQNWPFRLRS